MIAIGSCHLVLPACLHGPGRQKVFWLARPGHSMPGNPAHPRNPRPKLRRQHDSKLSFWTADSNAGRRPRFSLHPCQLTLATLLCIKLILRCYETTSSLRDFIRDTLRQSLRRRPNLLLQCPRPPKRMTRSRISGSSPSSSTSSPGVRRRRQAELPGSDLRRAEGDAQHTRPAQ